jgi:hypothetical protein
MCIPTFAEILMYYRILWKKMSKLAYSNIWFIVGKKLQSYRRNTTLAKVLAPSNGTGQGRDPTMAESRIKKGTLKAIIVKLSIFADSLLQVVRFC